MTGGRKGRIAPPLIYLGLFLLGLGMALIVDVLPGGPVAGVLIGIAIFAVAVGATVFLWRQLDEVAREAHKWAWYWGGPLGMALAFILLLGGVSPGAALRLPAETLQEAYTVGFAFCAAGQMAGYLVTWIGWWVSRSFSFGKEG